MKKKHYFCPLAIWLQRRNYHIGFIDFQLIYKISVVSGLCARPPGLPLVFPL